MKRIVIAAFLVFFSTSAFAGAIHWDPMDGNWAPKGTHAAIIYFQHNAADTIKKDGDTLVKGVDYEANIMIARWNTWQQLGKFPLQVSLILPFADVSAPSGTGTGIGDLGLVSQARFAKWNNGYFNAGLSVYFPTGRYDNERAVNVGSNRWAFRPSMIVANTWGGKFRIDWITAAEIYTKNNDFTAASLTLKKKPEIFTDLHFSYILQPESGTFVSATLGGTWMGKEEANGNEVNSNKSDFSTKFTFATNLNPTFQMMLSLTYDLQIENGPKGYGMQMRLAKMF